MKNHLYNEDRSSKHSKVNSGLNLQSLKQYNQGRYKNITPNLHNGDDSKKAIPLYLNSFLCASRKIGIYLYLFLCIIKMLCMLYNIINFL